MGLWAPQKVAPGGPRDLKRPFLDENAHFWPYAPPIALFEQSWTLSNTSRGVNLDLEGPQKVAPEAPDTPKMAFFGAFGALVPLYGGPKAERPLGFYKILTTKKN